MICMLCIIRSYEQQSYEQGWQLKQVPAESNKGCFSLASFAEQSHSSMATAEVPCSSRPSSSTSTAAHSMKQQQHLLNKSTYLVALQGHTPKRIASYSGTQRQALGFGQGSGKPQCTPQLHSHNVAWLYLIPP